MGRKGLVGHCCLQPEHLWPWEAPGRCFVIQSHRVTAISGLVSGLPVPRISHHTSCPDAPWEVLHSLPEGSWKPQHFRADGASSLSLQIGWDAGCAYSDPRKTGIQQGKAQTHPKVREARAPMFLTPAEMCAALPSLHAERVLLAYAWPRLLTGVEAAELTVCVSAYLCTLCVGRWLALGMGEGSAL